MQNVKEVPNRTYIEMNFVGETATGKGNNTQIIMEAAGADFLVTEGRVGIRVGRNRPKKYRLPMNEWDRFFYQKTGRGFLVTKTKKMGRKTVSNSSISVKGENYKPLEDKETAEIIRRLLSYSSEVIDTNFTVKVEDISDEMIAFGKKVLDELACGFKNMSIAEFNNKLKVLYAAIPRRMDNLSKHLASRKVEMNDIVANEQDLYDIMVAQVRDGHNMSAEKTILQAYGLDWRPVDAAEQKWLKRQMEEESDNYVRAWRISNHRTEKNFEDYCTEEGLEEDGISHLFHGSRNENFWSIITNGLTINPTGVVITGKMFGNGTYFAPKARKSMGYTSRCGSYWANGDSNTGFLAVYKVTTGKRYHPASSDGSLTWERLQALCPGAHCTWAKRGSGMLRNDEVIVYQDRQSTIEYLIEVGGH